MNDIKQFSPEVSEELKYYVYRLIDPRNGQTFYVGKGKNNRVFAHVEAALNNYENQNYLDEFEDNASTKIKTITDIKLSGLNVIHVIQRHGLTEKEAMEVESAVIDCFPGLTNLQSGYASDRGATNAITLENNLSLKCYDEPKDVDYIIIKTTPQRVSECEDSLYEATRGYWKISQKNTSGKYVLSVINGIVREVYKPLLWKKSRDYDDRLGFEGEIAEARIRNIFLNKRIPEQYRRKGSANPIQYKKR